MENQKLLVTMKDIQRHKILNDLIAKKLKGTQAAQILKLTPVHISRLKKRLLKGGFENILRKKPPQPPNQKISHADVQRILELRKSIYYDFNLLHFMEKLREIHKITYSYESIRQILVKAKEHIPKKRRKVHRQRRRMPKAGLLVQMDSSQHRWLPFIEQKWWLIATIDDATNEVPCAGFFFKDTVFANMNILRSFIEIKGLFYSLYVDKASHFKTTRHGGLHYNIPQEQEETQIERALEELGINLIPANSPQAKGRIEVTFRLFQDRLIKEMRLAGVKNYTQANRFLKETFLPWYNTRFSHKSVESAYMPLPKQTNLDLVFCIKKERTVNNDNTVQIYGQIIQILPSKIKRTFARSKVDTCLLEDKRIYVLYKGHVVAESKLSRNNKVLNKEHIVETILNQREYELLPEINKLKKDNPRPKVPEKNHPWRTLIHQECLEKLALKT
jgi:hypothetical protein